MVGEVFEVYGIDESGGAGSRRFGMSRVGDGVTVFLWRPMRWRLRKIASCNCSFLP